MAHESLLTKVGKAYDEFRSEREQRLADGVSGTLPTRTSRLRGWLPSPGNVLFTTIVIVGLLWGQSAGAITLGAPIAAGVSTGTIAYQGRLADTAGQPLTGTYNMTFRIYSAASGGAPLWEETWTGPNSVQVSDGLFNVMLGSLTAIPQSVVANNASLFLGITVGTDSEMAPRVQMGSVPFAVQALTVPDDSVTTAKIADGAVTQEKLGADVELTPPDGSINTAKLADRAVVPNKAAGFVVTGNNNLLVQYGFRTPVSGTDFRINFPKPFAGWPTVVASAESLGGQWINVHDVNTTGFNIRIPDTGGYIAINWIAIGPTN